MLFTNRSQDFRSGGSDERASIILTKHAYTDFPQIMPTDLENLSMPREMAIYYKIKPNIVVFFWERRPVLQNQTLDKS
jgi:hypothetical protein